MSHGRIVTFYSYKGGVGRTFALANIAVLLARWGCRVLCLDWDLEAPGLHFYFSVKPETGLLNLLEGVRSGAQPDWRQCVRNLDCSGTDGRLDLIAAGAQHNEYVASIQALNWDGLYIENDLGSYFEDLRRDWQNEYDLVLIDSRTGITDIGAICTAQLPDILVIVFTTNQQGLSGVIDVVERAQRARQRLPFERTKLLTVPVVSRFDAREEYDLAEQWKRIFAKELKPFYRTWLHERVDVNRAVDLCTIPYVSKWSFGEQLVVLIETRRSPHFITYSLENVAALLALRFERTDQFAESPDSYVSLAARESARTALSRASSEPERRFRHDVYISHPRELADYAEDLGQVLSKNELKYFLLDDSIPYSGDIQTQITDALTNSQHCVMLLGDKPNRWQEYEAVEFFKQTLEERSSRTFYPVRTGEMDPVSFHPLLASIKYVDARGENPKWVAERFIEIIKHQQLVSQPSVL